MAVHAVRRSEAAAAAKRRVADEEARASARAETVEGQAEQAVARIFRTGTARKSEVDRLVDRLDLYC